MYMYIMSHLYVYWRECMHGNSQEMLRKARQGNTIERQSNTTQLAQSSHFSKKNWLPQVGFEPMTFAL